MTRDLVCGVDMMFMSGARTINHRAWFYHFARAFLIVLGIGLNM